MVLKLGGYSLSDLNVAVVGATGAVGREMIKILEERNFPINNLKLIASERSEGKEILFRDNSLKVETLSKNIFKDIDIALFSINSDLSKKIAPQAVDEGAIVIDNSSAFRLDQDTPLVVPEINSERIFEHNGIIANPNCSTIQLVMAVKPIHDKYGIKRMVVSTYQAVSGTGKAAIDELKKQIEDFINQNELKSDVYPYQIAFNILPHIDIFYENGYTKEEMKVVYETRKIIEDSEIAITTTAARVPVFYGHSEAVNIEIKKQFQIKDISDLLNKANGVRVVDNIDENLYPLVTMVKKDDDILVGRIRRDHSIEKGLNLWVVGNNLRKGAALNAVQIAEKLV